MDFFDRQERARRQTRWLICLFGLVVLITVALIYLVVASVIWAVSHPLLPAARWNPLAFLITEVFLFGNALLHPLHFLRSMWSPQLATWITLGALVSIAGGCLYKLRLLSRGGPAVAELLGGRRVAPDTSDANEQRLRNVVAEMAVASGMPLPEIYVLDRERGINSFAAGHAQDDVAIGVTYGCLKLLTRDELQGVIAREFSHVLNGDTRLNMRLMALVHGLLWPTIAGRVLFYGTDSEPLSDASFFEDYDSAVRAAFAPVALPLVVIGSLGSPLVRLVKSLICRDREWLADAAAVQFTRNPSGIEGALKKVGGLLKQGRLDTPYAETASHFYFVNCVHDPWLRLQSTHPPLIKRILAIDPQFDGRFQRINSLPSHDASLDRIYEASVRRAQANAQTSWQDDA